MSKYRELLQQQAELNQRIEEARAAEFEAAAKQCRELIELYGLTPQDVGFVKTQQIGAKKVGKGDRTFEPKAPSKPVEPKYRDPNTGATWSGRGKAPKWIGEDRDAFLIA